MKLYNTQNSTQISEAVQDARKDPHALPSSFLCVYMCVFISWGLVTTSRFRNNGPRADILHMDRCGEKNLIPTFSLFLFLSLFPYFPFVSLYFSKHHISPYSPSSLIFDQRDCAPFSQSEHCPLLVLMCFIILLIQYSTVQDR